MTQQPIKIEYRVKVRKMEDGREYIDYKKKLNRSDCLLKPHEHAYYNCDMFPSILTESALNVQNNRTGCYLDELPQGVSVDTTAFLAVVNITC
jgi:hypothetical protein